MFAAYVLAVLLVMGFGVAILAGMPPSRMRGALRAALVLDMASFIAWGAIEKGCHDCALSIATLALTGVLVVALALALAYGWNRGTG